jgi:hypothetical protein
VEEEMDLLWKLLFKLWKNINLYGKIILFFLSVTILFFSSRIGVLGEGALSMTHLIYQNDIPFIDPDRPYLGMNFSVELKKCNEKSFSPINKNVVIPDNGSIRINFSPSSDSYVSIIGYDVNGYYSMFPKNNKILPNDKIEDALLRERSLNKLDLDHDDVVGDEFYIILFSRKSMKNKKHEDVINKIKMSLAKGSSDVYQSDFIEDVYLKIFSFKSQKSSAC